MGADKSAVGAVNRPLRSICSAFATAPVWLIAYNYFSIFPCLPHVNFGDSMCPYRYCQWLLLYSELLQSEEAVFVVKLVGHMQIREKEHAPYRC